MFEGWNYITNLEAHYNGRVLIAWRPDYNKVVHVNVEAQIVTCKVLHIPL